MENELIRMQRYVAERNRQTGMPLGNVEETITDDEGFSPSAPAPAPPATVPREDVPEVPISNPRAALEQYQASAYPPKVTAVDLDAKMVQSTHGRFPLNEEEVKAITAACIQSIQRSFDRILVTLAEQAGFSVQSDDKGGAAASSQPAQDESSVSSTPRGKGRSRSAT